MAVMIQSLKKPLFSGFFLPTQRRQMTSPLTQKGFSIIELIIVIVIIGVLATMAGAKYFDSTETAYDHNTASIAGSLNSASARNYTRFKLGKTYVSLSNCIDAAGLLPTGLPSGYSITDKTLTIGEPTACTLNSTFSSNTEVFMGIGVSS